MINYDIKLKPNGTINENDRNIFRWFLFKNFHEKVNGKSNEIPVTTDITDEFLSAV